MNKLVIFYSLNGNTKLIAENIAQAAGADLLELKPKKDIPSKGLMKYLQGGKAAVTKAKTELLPFDKDPGQYDLFFIGTPVWAGTYTPALNTFFATHPLSNKKIALFCCHLGGKGKIFDKMKEVLKDNHILGEIDFKEPLKKNTDENIKKARDWTEIIIKSL